MTTAEKLRDALPHFTGTTKYYRVSPGLLATEGVYFLCDEAEAFWLTDLIWSILDSVGRQADGFFFITLNVAENQSAEFRAFRDTDEELYYQHIISTNFPLEELKLYVSLADERQWVVMLPSEY